jgi:hypothetical protein
LKVVPTPLERNVGIAANDQRWDSRRRQRNASQLKFVQKLLDMTDSPLPSDQAEQADTNEPVTEKAEPQQATAQPSTGAAADKKTSAAAEDTNGAAHYDQRSYPPGYDYHSYYASYGYGGYGPGYGGPPGQCCCCGG